MERLTLEVSEELLNAVGSVLDIRQVFPEVSAIVQSLLPHDRLTMTLHDGRRTLIAYAFSNDDGPFLVRASSPEFEAMGDVRAKIIHDLMAEESTATFDPPDYRERAKAAGYRSILSVPVRAREQLSRCTSGRGGSPRSARPTSPWRVTSRCMSPSAFRTNSWRRPRVEQRRPAPVPGGSRRASRRCPPSSRRAPVTAGWRVSPRRGRTSCARRRRLPKRTPRSC